MAFGDQVDKLVERIEFLKAQKAQNGYGILGSHTKTGVQRYLSILTELDSSQRELKRVERWLGNEDK